jgi:hypothetical protein
LFSCYSGLTYIELKELTSDNLVKGMDGKDWIILEEKRRSSPLRFLFLILLRKLLKNIGDIN